MAYEFLNLEQDGAVAVVTINRPAVLNALSEACLLYTSPSPRDS